MTKTTQLTEHYYRSLNRNIILIIILVSVIPLIIVSSTIYYQFRASYHEKVYDHLRELVYSHTRNIDYFLMEKLGGIRFLAESYGRDKLENEAFLHARLADTETAAASPAERKFLAAAVAPLQTAFATFLPVGGRKARFIHGCCFIPLLV